MAWIALVGPEIEENLSLRYLCSSVAIGKGQPLTEIGDRVATPLQTQRLAVGS